MAVTTCSPGELLDTFWVNSRVHDTGNPAVSSVAFGDGLRVRVVVDGNHDVWGSDTTLKGNPQPIMYPASGDESTLASFDADTQFASSSTGYVGPNHSNQFHLDTGDGQGLIHREPDGGPFSAFVAGHTYQYPLIGRGLPFRAAISDSPLVDNSGQYRVRVYCRGVGGWHVGPAAVRIG